MYTFKFNNGNFALLCSDCGTMVKTGVDFTEKEWSALDGKGDIQPTYCDKCKVNHVDDVIIPEKKEIPLDFIKNVLPFLENEELKKNLLENIIQNKFNLDILSGSELPTHARGDGLGFKGHRLT